MYLMISLIENAGRMFNQGNFSGGRTRLNYVPEWNVSSKPATRNIEKGQVLMRIIGINIVMSLIKSMSDKKLTALFLILQFMCLAKH